MPHAIDLNRGVTIREEPSSHAQVFMYKDSPGVYLNTYGQEVPEALARAAGFPVEELAKERKFKADLAAAAETLRGQMDASKGNQKTVKEGDNYRLVQMGKESFLVETVDGKAMHPGHLSKQVATVLYDSLEPEKAKASSKGKTKED